MGEIGAKNCGHCGKDRTPEGHDGCLGTLPGVMNACCGHGGNAEGAYIQYWDGSCLRDDAAMAVFAHAKAVKDKKSDSGTKRFKAAGLAVRIMTRFDGDYPRWPQSERPLLLALARAFADQAIGNAGPAEAMSDILSAVGAIAGAAGKEQRECAKLEKG